EASSVNGHDAMVRSGGLKVVSGRRFPIGVGLDFAGTVAATGAGVGGYQVGDRVWGTVHPRRRHVTGAAADYVLVPADRVALAPIAASSVHGARRIRAFSANPDAALLRDLAGYVASGAVRPVVDSVYPLPDIVSAHQAFERGGVVGKQVITVSNDW